MAYNGNNYRNNNDNRRNSNYRNSANESRFPKYSTPLSTVFTNPVDLYLPNGTAWNYAKEFERIPNHQMRKILNLVKSALLTADKDIFGAKKQMFVIVAMSAYNAGRLKGDLMKLEEFIENTINEKTICDKKDIEAFDQLFTSIVAYHKRMSR